LLLRFAARFDYEYERNGTANLFMLFAPLDGWHVKVTDRYTAIDYARVLKDLADIHFPRAKTIVLILAIPSEIRLVRMGNSGLPNQRSAFNQAFRQFREHALSHAGESRGRDRTGWLPWKDSNFSVSISNRSLPASQAATHVSRLQAPNGL